MNHHYRFLAAFLFAAQTPIGVVCGIEIAQGNWVLITIAVAVMTVMEAGAWAILDYVRAKENERK